MRNAIEQPSVLEQSNTQIFSSSSPTIYSLLLQIERPWLGGRPVGVKFLYFGPFWKQFLQKYLRQNVFWK